MTISKRRIISYIDYINDLVDCGRRYAAILPSRPKNECLTEIEMVELAGHLLNHSMASAPQDIGDTLLSILEHEGFFAADLMVAACINDSPEANERLLTSLKKAMVAYFEPRMQDLLDARREELSDAKHEDAGHIRKQDMVTGEFYWAAR